MESWKKIKEEIVYQGAYRSMKEKTFLLPSGEPRTYEIQAEQSFVVVMCVTDDGKIVTFDRFMPGLETSTVAFPGGHIDPGEDAVAAALREVMEETGYAPDKLVFLKTAACSAYGEANEHDFIALGCKPVAESDHDDPELSSMRLVPLAEVAMLTYDPAVTNFEHVQCAAFGLEYLRKHGLWQE